MKNYSDTMFKKCTETESIERIKKVEENLKKMKRIHNKRFNYKVY